MSTSGKKHEKKNLSWKCGSGLTGFFFPQIPPSGVDSWISNFGEVANSRAGETQIGKRTRWWFQTFLIFTPTRGNDPI